MAIDYTQANRIFASLDDVPPAAVRILALALTLANRPLADLGQAFDYWADHREDPAVISGDLARLRLSRAIRTTTRNPECERLLERLEGVSEPPWPEIREALLEAQS
jgi:hypothetical protein